MKPQSQHPDNFPTSRKRLTFLIALLCAILGFHAFHSRNREGHIRKPIGNEAQCFERTANKHRDSLAAMFRKYSRSLTIGPDGARFLLGPGLPGFGTGNPEDLDNRRYESDFTLSKPGDIFYQQDHHGRTDFAVRQITADSIVIGYKITFSHTSFGKNLVTEDTGEFTLTPFANS